MVRIERVRDWDAGWWIVRDADTHQIYKVKIDHVHAGNTTFWAYRHQLEALSGA